MKTPSSGNAFRIASIYANCGARGASISIVLARASSSSSFREALFALCFGRALAKAVRTVAASPTIPISGLLIRSISSAERSIRIIFKSLSVPQSCWWGCIRVPTPSTTSTSFQRRWPVGMVIDRWCRESRTPRPRRKLQTGASNISPTSRTSALASCAPPPTTIIGFFAAPSIFAAVSTLSISTSTTVSSAGPLGGVTGAARPQTSIGHSSPMGRGRPAPNCRKASWVSRAASVGPSMRSAHFVIVRRIPIWSRIS